MDKSILKRFTEDLLPVGVLEVVWPDAQQPFVPRHAKTIAEKFDWELIGMCFVCGPFKTGKYHIIDGQHRKDAVFKKFGADETIPCRVYPALDKAHAAWLFNQINDQRRRPRKIDLFRTAVTSGSEPEASIAKVVKSVGMTVGPSGIMGVGALINVFKLGGASLLGQSLVSIREAWGTDIAKTADASVIRIFAGFLHAYGDADMGRLVSVIAKQYTLGRFLGTVKSISDMQRVSTTEAGIAMLVRTYNTGLRVGKGRLADY